MQFTPVQTLSSVTTAVMEQPLEPGDSRYSPLEVGLNISALRQLRVRFEQALGWTSPTQFVRVAFTGHKGCGKTTELFRLEHELAPQFLCLHLPLDASLRSDLSYPELFLWLVDALAEHVQSELKLPLDPKTVGGVVKWFAEMTQEVDETIKKEVSLETEAGGGADSSWFGLRAKLMATLKSMIRGSHEARTKIRLKLQHYSTDLLDRVNVLLQHVNEVIQKADPHQVRVQRRRLLLVFDDLDKLAPDTAEILFFRHGEILKGLNADLIFTVPVAIALIGTTCIPSCVTSRRFKRP
ncbi:MAG: hypothetical protein ACKV2Q_28965 [Planctomycetaceae bacterium]